MENRTRGQADAVISSSRVLFWILTAGFLVSGCASYKPKFDSQAGYFQRMETQENGSVKVSVVGLSAQESRETFGTNLTSKHILPLWIQIENHDPDHAYLFVERSIHPEYYTAGEAAFMTQFHAGYRLKPYLPPFLVGLVRTLALPFENVLAGSANNRMREEFEAHALKHTWIQPNETRSGFMFVPFELGTIEVPLDLYSDQIKEGKGVVKNFNFFIHIPGLKTDYADRDFNRYYTQDQVTDIQDEIELLTKVKELPCCISSQKGNADADPINLIVIGEPMDVRNSFVASKWDETEMIYWGSIWKMAKAFLMNKKYLYSPISPQYYDGRSQDIAFQKARETINERMHLRLWYSRLKYRGRPVWVGAVSRDIGVRFTTKAWNLMTHAIDPDLDEAALYTLSDLIYWHRLDTYGVVGGVPPSTKEKPHYNMMGAPYYTSGNRVVLSLSKLRHMEFPARMAAQGAAVPNAAASGQPPASA